MKADRASRLAVIALAMACGILVAERFTASPPFAVGITVLACLLVVVRPRLVTLVLAACVLGASLTSLRLASIDRGALAVAASRSADALLEGRLVGDMQGRVDGARVVLAVRRAELDGRPLRVREKVLLTVRPPPQRSLHGGVIVRVDTRLRPVRLPGMDARGRAAATRLRRSGVSARAFARADTLQVLGRSRAPLVVAAEAGRAAVRRAAAHLPPDRRGLLLGVTIGDTSLLPPEVDLDFRTTGLSHLVAVSGANVAMVLAVAAAITRGLRAGRRVTIAILGATVIAFMAITRFEPSVMRAGVMAAVALLASAAGARRDALVALAGSVVVLLVLDPFLLHSIGFQLSILATLGILVVAPKIAQRLPDGPLWTVAAVTAGAQLCVAPLLAMRFGELSLVSLAANLVVAPAVAPATVIGMVAAMLGMVWEPLAALAVTASPAIGWMQWAARVMAELPLATVSTPAGAAALAISAASVAAASVVARFTGRRMLAGASAVAVLCGSIVWAGAREPALPACLTVTMLDVGQGDAMLLRCDGRSMLVDGGPDPAGMVAQLRKHGVRRVDLLVTTHPHEDHVAGLVRVAEQVPVARTLDPYIEDDLPSYRRLIAAVASRGIPRDRARAGMRYALGRATVEVLWPPGRLMEGTEADINNNSIVLRVVFGRNAVLLAGETQEEAQTELLRRPSALVSTVLKVSHHGSARMVPAFYQASRARIALIPVGPNTFGHPAPATLEALTGMTIFRSDRHGEVAVVVPQDGATAARATR